MVIRRRVMSVCAKLMRRNQRSSAARPPPVGSGVAIGDAERSLLGTDDDSGRRCQDRRGQQHFGGTQSRRRGTPSIDFIPEDSLPANRRLKFVLEQRLVTDLYGNSPADSLFQFDYRFASPDSLGTLTGTIKSHDTVTIVLQGIGRRMKYTFSTAGTEHYPWQLCPDSYTLYAFADQNHNRRWDLGTLAPFTFAEPGWIVADTIKIRARFEREGFDLDLK